MLMYSFLCEHVFISLGLILNFIIAASLALYETTQWFSRVVVQLSTICFTLYISTSNTQVIQFLYIFVSILFCGYF